MSQAGRPSQRGPSNGNNLTEIPPDIEWDEDNHPFIYPCSQHTEHVRGCKGTEDPIELDSELQVRLLNEARAYARAGMSFAGIPASYANHIPIPGIQVELVDVLVWLETAKELLCELSGLSKYELDERFRDNKLALLQSIREENEARVRKHRVASSLGIVEKPGLLGPDGTPI